MNYITIKVIMKYMIFKILHYYQLKYLKNMKKLEKN